MSWSLPLQASLQYGLYLELQTKLCQDFTIMVESAHYWLISTQAKQDRWCLKCEREIVKSSQRFD